MIYGDFSRKLKREFREINGVKTAIFSTSFRENRKTILLVHGINGSHFGLEFLAKNLAETFNLILIDLPGHGKSSLPDNPEHFALDDLRTWFEELVESLSLSQINIVAHSFGCYALTPKLSRKYKTIFICPVPSAKKSSRFLGLLTEQLFSLKIFAKIYNWVPFAAFRGDMMLRDTSRENRKKQHCVASADAKTSSEFRKFQAKLAVTSFQKDIFANVKPELVIYGKYDFVPAENSTERLSLIFPNSQLVSLPTGHLPTTEAPEKLAASISSSLR